MAKLFVDLLAKYIEFIIIGTLVRIIKVLRYLVKSWENYCIIQYHRYCKNHRFVK